jgi:spore coat protein CotF
VKMHTNYLQVDSFFMKYINMQVNCSSVQVENYFKISFNSKKVKVKVVNNVFNLEIIPTQINLNTL